MWVSPHTSLQILICRFLCGALPHTPLKELFAKSSLRIFKKLKQGICFRFLFIFQSLTVSSFEGLYGALRGRVGGFRKSEIRLRRPAFSLTQSRLVCCRSDTLTTRHCKNFIYFSNFDFRLRKSSLTLHSAFCTLHFNKSQFTSIKKVNQM